MAMTTVVNFPGRLPLQRSPYIVLKYDIITSNSCIQRVSYMSTKGRSQGEELVGTHSRGDHVGVASNTGESARRGAQSCRETSAQFGRIHCSWHYKNEFKSRLNV